MPKKTKRTGKTTVLVLGDQLRPDISSLSGVEPGECVVLMVESLGRARKLDYHRQKLVLIFSAMRHFADELRGLGYDVDYREEQGSFTDGLKAHIEEYAPDEIRLMQSAEYGGSENVAKLVEGLDPTVEITPNNMFLSDGDAFEKWAEGKKELRMETFYRRERKRLDLLMNGGEPEGGSWNFDKENRESPESGHAYPEVPTFRQDKTTKEVREMVEREFPENFGSLERFLWPVTRDQAEAFFEGFVTERLDLFGPYEDAIVTGERAMYHSLISPLVNLGLLDPLTMCEKAEEKYRSGKARINSVEGFIRQIIGWREFMYRVYRLKMPDYIEMNHLEADLPLPDFYWTADTRMNCVSEAVRTVVDYGINHHIQRLMVTGNFALIAGIDPQQVNEWYWFAYADGYEWVTTPNVVGMTLYADGGIVGTKPYAASANYINRMSDHCGGCRFDPKKATGDDACPFNALYWDFLARNREEFEKNPRMNLVMSSLKKKKDLDEIREKADEIRANLEGGGDVV